MNRFDRLFEYAARLDRVGLTMADSANAYLRNRAAGRPTPQARPAGAA